MLALSPTEASSIHLTEDVMMVEYTGDVTNKTQETYERTFNLLKQNCAELHIEFKEVFKKEQSMSEVRMQQLATGATPPRRARIEELKFKIHNKCN